MVMILKQIIKAKKKENPELKLIKLNKKEMIKQVNATFKKDDLEITDISYCCYGVENSCWYDAIECWIDTYEGMKEIVVDRINKLSGDIYYYNKKGFHQYLIVDFRDKGKMPSGYKLSEHSLEAFKEETENIEDIPYWDKDTWTIEDYYNRYHRYKRNESWITIRDRFIKDEIYTDKI